MEDENKNNNLEEKTKSQPESRTVLSREEIKKTIREFVLAWIKGDVIIDFPDAHFYTQRAKLEKEPMNFKEASELESLNKQNFMQLIEITGGEKPSTVEEEEKAVSKLFNYILALRCGERIKGTFGKQEDFERRLSRVEEEIIAMNDSIQQLIIWYRSLLQSRE